jgi:hypothetical protein
MEKMKTVGNKRIRLFELQGFDHNQMINPACNIILKYVAESSKIRN